MSCPCHTCLLFIDPARIMTMFYNKASQMDPHVSCLVVPVTGATELSDKSSFKIDLSLILIGVTRAALDKGIYWSTSSRSI